MEPEARKRGGVRVSPVAEKRRMVHLPNIACKTTTTDIVRRRNPRKQAFPPDESTGQQLRRCRAFF